MTTYYTFMDVAMLIIGVYCFYSWYMFVFKKNLDKVQLFLSQSQKTEKCKDKDGFIKRFSPALFIFSLAFFAIGLVFSLNDIFVFFPVSETFRIYTVPLAAIVIGMVVYTRLVSKKYW